MSRDRSPIVMLGWFTFTGVATRHEMSLSNTIVDNWFLDTKYQIVFRACRSHDNWFSKLPTTQRKMWLIIPTHIGQLEVDTSTIRL